MFQVFENQNDQELIFNKSIFRDIHCDPQYVRIYDRIQWGKSLFFYIEDSSGFVAFPFFIFFRDIGNTTIKEVRSIYGYTSLLSDTEMSCSRFLFVIKAFINWCETENVCVGSLVLDPRLNQFLADIPSEWLSRQKSVFSLDGPRMDWNKQKFCKKAAADARYFFKAGVVDLVDGIDMDISLFDEMYRKTMDRVEAADRWYWPMQYWKTLSTSGNEFDCKFAVASIEGEPCLVSMFIGANSTFYYHFSASQGMPTRGASAAAFFRFSDYAFERGASRVHLGGGVSGLDTNPLARFKRSLSNVVEDLYLLKLVIDGEAYSKAGGVDDGLFFPRYEVV